MVSMLKSSERVRLRLLELIYQKGIKPRKDSALRGRLDELGMEWKRVQMEQ